MADDRIEGRDIYSEAGWIARKGEEIHETVRNTGAVLCVDDAILHTTLVLPNEDAARLGAFALDAAGVDLVGAARKVGEARAAYLVTLDACAAPGADRGAYRARDDADDVYVAALDVLAAELAKLDGVS